MRIGQTGKITEDLYMLGHPAVPVYLLDGRQPVIFDAGLAVLGERYLEDLRQVLGRRPPAFCLLTHSHFDHCGAAGIFKARFSNLQVVCSQHAKQVFARPNARQLIRQLNLDAVQTAIQLGVQPSRGEFVPFQVDRTVQEGDRIEVSPDLAVEVLETPGHTRDFLSYYLPSRRVLMASEAMGTLDATGYIVTDCLVDYDLHYASMQKLARLEVDVLLLAHLYALTGGDARAHMYDSLVQAEKFRHMVEQLWNESGGDLQGVREHLKAYEYDRYEGIKIPEQAYLLNLEARIKTVVRKISSSV